MCYSFRQSLRYCSVFVKKHLNFCSTLPLLEKFTNFLDFFSTFIGVVPLFTGSLGVARDDVLLLV